MDKNKLVEEVLEKVARAAEEGANTCGGPTYFALKRFVNALRSHAQKDIE